MKVINKAIDVIAHTNAEGVITPKRFKMIDENGENKVINVDRVSRRDKVKFAGKNIIAFVCQSVIDDSMRVYELRYCLEDMRWVLYKI